ncbi:glycoside hydrolase family 25 protein [Nocardia sp. NBC_01503]|uniref:glycoside hydrolase family 25 protein n=1 Tax=Nocardia sp. NBC_01503 TaxID=2975997 RepID=UPI002E7B1AE6|nr:glycoside hydrolase family 25 protein [Nocardia sp. NBC_01503]WTL35638.1 glycoside hydrolase family 25 protein [Nocardia sp. NBC_01503]
MTIFGIDISNNNGPDIDLAAVAREGFRFVFAKVSEGDGFVDYTWPAYREAAHANGLLVAGYHYLRADADIEAQAELFVSRLGDAAAMVDFEENSGGIDTFWAFVDAVNALGRTINLSYIPRWYWQRIGCPDLSKVPGLIQSSYVAGSGLASMLYPGDDTGFWNGFGGKDVDLLQFTDKAYVAGHLVDANAFAGTFDQLRALLGLTLSTDQGVLMALTDAQQLDLYQKVREIWEQLRGPDGDGWPQLGKNAQGQNVTLVDACAMVRDEIAAIAAASHVAPAQPKTAA